MPPHRPTEDFATRLQAAVGDGYRINQELGGGGMSRVFLAEEVRLGRMVVIKVLPPEMGAGVNVERFEREIQLAARLQHPHVVPLLSAGAEGDLLYYTMPFIQGESLRQKLAREGELPVSDALRILKEVADALAYAHAEGVVHRDIKPDNVLLSGRHAVVTDFGVAKAVSASTGESSLTSLGVALGTPAYMSPEQAAASPNVDHRADIYALGALAYEMVCGRPPFTGANPQSVLAAHVTQAPDAPSSVRSTIPPALNELILRCLSKLPADRPQKADELIPHFDALLTPTGGTTPTATQPVPSVEAHAAAARAHPIRVGALFALASVGVLALVYGVIQVIGLPGWVFWGAIGLLLAGLPVMLLTGHHERRRALKSTTGMRVTPTGLQRHFTWRKALVGGGLGFAALTVLTGGYMAMRSLGIGPLGTLLASGVLEDRSKVIVADFENRTADSTLGPSVTEALRIDLGQSPVIRLLETTDVAPTLRLMGRDPGSAVDFDVAREIAQREGASAIVRGEISPLGQGFVISARLIAADDGRTLVPVRETTNDAAGLIDAVDRLSAKLRERIGESLKGIRASARLSEVTTPSLPALRKYTEGLAALNAGEADRAVSLFEDAVAIDTSFAMAWRKLGVHLSNMGVEPARSAEAVRKAYAHRNRLTDRERYITVASYGNLIGDWEMALDGYRDMVEADPRDVWGLVGVGLTYGRTGDLNRGIEYYERALAIDSTEGLVLSTLADFYAAAGKPEDAWATWGISRRAHPQVPYVFSQGAALSAVVGDYTRADAMADTLAGLAQGSRYVRTVAAATRDVLARARGRLTTADRSLEALRDAAAGSGQRNWILFSTATAASADVTVRNDPAAGIRRMAAAVTSLPLDSLHPLERPYLELAEFFAMAGEPARARALLSEWEREVETDLRRARAPDEIRARGMIAFAENRFERAVELLRQSSTTPPLFCDVCVMAALGRAYEAIGQRDSALAAYRRYAESTHPVRASGDGVWLAATYERLGELYEERNDRERAVEYYTKFVELWQDADPELQALVRDVRARIARLAGER